MTREEAIMILKDCELNPCVPKDKEATNMAIKALEQQPCEDAVSRKAVVEYIKNSDAELGHDSENELVVEDILTMPPVTPTQKWIPVSERLPEEPYGCLVTVWDINPVTMDEFENILPYFVGWDGEQWNDGDGEQCPFEVVAWMPLPEQYKAESEEL